MLSMIEVTCPHCGTKGQIMLPPMSTIIVGPCPECQGLVVVFCGNALSLDNEIMLHGSVEERREHLMGVLTDFLHDRIWQILPDENAEDNAETEAYDPSALEATQEEPSKILEVESHLTPTNSGKQKTQITQEEHDIFVTQELSLLDNAESFRALFG